MRIRQLSNGYSGQLSKIPAVLVGTKLDLDDVRAVGFEEGLAAAKEIGCSYIETSAAANRGVVKAFTKAVRLVPTIMLEDDWLQTVHVEKKPQRSAVKSVKGFLRRCSTFSVRKNRRESPYMYSRKFVRSISE